VAALVVIGVALIALVLGKQSSEHVQLTTHVGNSVRRITFTFVA